MKHRHVRVAIHEVGELQLRLKPKMEVELELGEPLPVVQAQDIAVAPPGAPGMKKGGKVSANDMLHELTTAISAELGNNKGWQLFSDSDDPDSQTLLFEYQSKKSNADYVRPIVKIEIGARSEHWPVSEHIVHSYTKEALKEKIQEPADSQG